jgi:thioredoxin 1
MAHESIVTLTAENFETEVLKSEVPVLVDFWAEWCGPCKMLAPVLDDLAGDYGGKLKIGKVNVDENQQLATQFGIMNIPTLLLFNKGQVVKQIMGLKSKKAYMQEIDQALA